VSNAAVNLSGACQAKSIYVDNFDALLGLLDGASLQVNGPINVDNVSELTIVSAFGGGVDAQAIYVNGATLN
jgi:hypothetical protein